MVALIDLPIRKVISFRIVLIERQLGKPTEIGEMFDVVVSSARFVALRRAAVRD